MKKFLKNVASFVLVLSLAMGITTISSEAKAIKGVVVPINMISQDGGLRGFSAVSSWNKPGIFSQDLNAYKLSADVYLPRAMFSKDNESVFISPMIEFWFEDLGVNAYLENDTTVRVGFDFVNNCPFYKGLPRGGEGETDGVPFVKEVSLVNDMIKVELVDVTVIPTLKKADFGENGREDWTDPLPTTGDVTAFIDLTADYSVSTNYVVTNASVKVGDKEYKTDYNSSGEIAGVNEEMAGYSQKKASTINTVALSVAKTSVKVKKKKSTTVKVTTMFSGDKVKVSSSSAKVAKASYKSGKITIKGVKKGKATVTVKANGKTKKIKVTVK